MPAQPPVDSQRVNAPLTGKKDRSRTYYFSSSGGGLKVGGRPIIMKFPLWNQRELHKGNLDFDLDP